MIVLPEPAAIARFRRDLEILSGETPSRERKLGVAVSGGGDSLGLLLLAHAAFPGTVVAATVDHGLRAEAAQEARFVQDLCADLGVPHAVLTRPMDYRFDGNVQQQARELRYALLQDWSAVSGAAWVATGHHRNDLAETLLMRARRGAGVGGLAAMRAIRPLANGDGGVHLIRPLLDWDRAELAAIVQRAGVIAIEDPSNHDPRFDRSRMRTLLAATPDLPVDRLALAAQNLRHAEDALEWTTQREWTARAEITGEGAVWLDMADIPYELRRRLARRAIEQVRGPSKAAGVWRGDGLDRFVAQLEAGQTATLAGVLARPGARWRFVAAPPRRSH